MTAWCAEYAPSKGKRPRMTVCLHLQCGLELVWMSQLSYQLLMRAVALVLLSLRATILTAAVAAIVMVSCEQMWARGLEHAHIRRLPFHHRRFLLFLPHPYHRCRLHLLQLLPLQGVLETPPLLLCHLWLPPLLLLLMRLHLKL